MFFKLLSGLNRSGQFGKQVKHFGAVPAAFEIAVVPFSNLGVVPDTVKRIDDPALCFERNRNFMLTKELHNERFAVDLPVYHLLSRHNISFGLTDGGIVTGLSFLCQLLFTGVLLRPPFISLPLPFRSNGGIVGFCFLIPSKQIGKSQISPPVRGFHTLIENPLDLTPDAMLQRGQPFQDFLKPVPLVNAHHKPVTWNINCLEELPFLLHCVEFNAVFVVEAVVVVLVAHQVFGKDPVLVFFLGRKDVLFLFIRSGIAWRKTGALQTVCNQLLDFFNTAMLLNETG